MENANNVQVEKLLCHDCQAEIEVKGEELVSGKVLVFKDGGKTYEIAKCDACYQKDPSLANFQKCEVYSRIVGYIRPVSQWNDAKQHEFQDRVTYKVGGCACD